VRTDLGRSTAPAEIVAAADDFGHIVHHVPAAVIHPDDAAGVAAATCHAAAAGLPIKARGAGHSFGGQAQCDGGTILDLSGLADVDMTASETVSVGAGATWRSILAVTLSRGMTPSVLTDYIGTTVGGTLSAGGIGGASHQYGPQVDNVIDIDVVTPAGELTTCSPAVRPDLFHAVLGGQGQAGIITRATLPLTRAPERMRCYKVELPSAGALIALQLRLAAERQLAYLEGQIMAGDGRWGYFLEAAAGYSGDEPPTELGLEPGSADDLSYADFCDRMMPGIRLLAATGDWYRMHPCLSVFLPSSAACRYTETAVDGFDPGSFGPLPILLYPIRRGPVPAAGFATPPGDETGLFYSFSALRTCDRGEVGAALDYNHELEQAAIAAGGTVYSISSLPQRG
jgi:cytokinin dehydrogenase